MLLRETQNCLADLASTLPYSFGVHFATEPTSGAQGLLIGEVAYDPAVHLPENISALSPMEMVTGQPYVEQVIPQQSLDVAVILHHRNRGNDPRIGAVKLQLARDIRDTLVESMPSGSDTVRSYYIGDPVENLDYDVEELAADADPRLTARSVAELCWSGLNFVISDFSNLPLGQEADAEFPNTIALKTNHQMELALPANVGIVRVGTQLDEVDTGKPRKLDEFNKKLADYHHNLVLPLKVAGIAVAQLVYGPQPDGSIGFDVGRTDQLIAGTIRSLNLG